MGSEFHRLVMAALAAGLLVIPGCGAGGGSTPTDGQGTTTTPAAVQPKIVKAEVDGATSVRLTFSEEMKPATGVDPSKFRLTVGYYAKAGTANGKYQYQYQYYAGQYYSGKYGSYTHYYSN